MGSREGVHVEDLWWLGGQEQVGLLIQPHSAGGGPPGGLSRERRVCRPPLSCLPPHASTSPALSPHSLPAPSPAGV